MFASNVPAIRAWLLSVTFGSKSSIQPTDRCNTESFNPGIAQTLDKYGKSGSEKIEQ